MSNSRFITRSALVNVMSAAVEKASRGLLRDFGEIENLQVSPKGVGDFVTVADKKSEKILIQELQKARPHFSILSEEAGFIEGANPDHKWIIDPLDGTSNFMHGIPHFAITVALEFKEEIIAAVTYDPVKDELFWSEKGRGAYLNQRRLRVSSRRALDEVLVGLPSKRHEQKDVMLENKVSQIVTQVSGVRRMGVTSLDLAYVACGRLDVFFDHSMNIWDYASGLLFIQESGGKVTSLFDEEICPLNTHSVLASNSMLYKEFRSFLS